MTAPQPHWLRDLNPFTQGAILSVLIVAPALFDWRVSLGIAIICFGLAAWIGRLGRFVGIWAKTIVVLSLVILVLQTIFVPGETELYRVWIFAATVEGFHSGVAFAGRVFGVGTALVLAMQVIDITRLVRAMEQRQYNPSVTYVILATANIIPEMAKNMGSIMDAQRARGIETDSNLFVRAKAFVPTIGPLILTSIVGVEEKVLTLESRGFSVGGQHTSLYEIVDPPGEHIIRVVAGLIIIGLIVGRIAVWAL